MKKNRKYAADLLHTATLDLQIEVFRARSLMGQNQAFFYGINCPHSVPWRIEKEEFILCGMIESVSEGLCKTLFQPGVRVECVDGEFSPSVRAMLPELPLAGSIYTVEKLDYTRPDDDKHSHTASIQLVELQSQPKIKRLARPFWSIDRFRPVQTKANREILRAWKVIREITPGFGHSYNSEKTDIRTLNLVSAYLSCEGWEALARSNIMLAMLIANCSEFDGLGKVDMGERQQKYLQMKRSKVCGALGFRATESTVRLLEKIQFGLFDEQSHLFIRILRMLTHVDPEAVKALHRFPRIGYWEIAAVGFGFDMLQLNKAVSPDEVDGMAWFFSRPLHERALVMNEWYQARFWNDPVVDALAPPFRRVASFKKCTTAMAWYSQQDSVRRAIHYAGLKVSKEMGANRDWPPPPVPPAWNMEPITDMYDLTKEGEEMENCAASYADKVMRGEAYLYRVTSPERCTLSIEYKNELWAIGELRTFRNQPCTDPKMHAMLIDWLGAQESTGPCNQRKAFFDAVAAEAEVRLSRKNMSLSKKSKHNAARGI